MSQLSPVHWVLLQIHVATWLSGSQTRVAPQSSVHTSQPGPSQSAQHDVTVTLVVTFTCIVSDLKSKGKHSLYSVGKSYTCA